MTRILSDRLATGVRPRDVCDRAHERNAPWNGRSTRTLTTRSLSGEGPALGDEWSFTVRKATCSSVLIGPGGVGYRSVPLPDEAGRDHGACRMSHRLPLAVVTGEHQVDQAFGRRQAGICATRLPCQEVSDERTGGLAAAADPLFTRRKWLSTLMAGGPLAPGEHDQPIGSARIR